MTYVWFCDYHYVKCTNDLEAKFGGPNERDKTKSR